MIVSKRKTSKCIICFTVKFPTFALKFTKTEKMKKLFSMLIVAGMVAFTVTSCGEEEGKEKTDESAPKTDEADAAPAGDDVDAVTPEGEEKKEEEGKEKTDESAPKTDEADAATPEADAEGHDHEGEEGHDHEGAEGEEHKCGEGQCGEGQCGGGDAEEVSEESAE